MILDKHLSLRKPHWVNLTCTIAKDSSFFPPPEVISILPMAMLSMQLEEALDANDRECVN